MSTLPPRVPFVPPMRSGGHAVSLVALGLLALLVSARADAAVALADGCQNTAISGTSGSCTATIPSGAALYVNLHCDGDMGAISSAVWNTSEALTSRQSTSTRRFSVTWSLATPTAATADVAVAWTNSVVCILKAVYVTGADTGGTLDDGPDVANGVDAAPTNAVDSGAAGDLVIDFLVVNNDDGDVTATGGNTILWEGTNSSQLTTAVSSTAATGGSVTASYTTDFHNWEVIAFNVNAGGGGGGSPGTEVPGRLQLRFGR